MQSWQREQQWNECYDANQRYRWCQSQRSRFVVLRIPSIWKWKQKQKHFKRSFLKIKKPSFIRVPMSGIFDNLPLLRISVLSTWFANTYFLESFGFVLSAETRKTKQTSWLTGKRKENVWEKQKKGIETSYEVKMKRNLMKKVLIN